MNSFALAVSFLTAIPVRVAESVHSVERSVRFFPVVGLLVGGILALADVLLIRILPAGVVDLAIVLLLTGTTNGFHLDGLADTLDGLGGGASKEETLRIMKDSGIGAFGAAGILFDLFFKYLLIMSLSPGIKLFALATFPMVSRWAVSVSLATQPSPRGERGLAGGFGRKASGIDLMVATLVTISVSAVLLKWRAIPVLILTSAATLLTIAYFKKRLGGMTGDNHGALNELVEILVLLSFTVLR